MKHCFRMLPFEYSQVLVGVEMVFYYQFLEVVQVQMVADVEIGSLVELDMDYFAVVAVLVEPSPSVWL